MEQDDGTRGWGENIRPIIKRMGTAATNKYLQDPIPSRPQATSGSETCFQADFPRDTSHSSPAPATGNFDGRIIAVQKEIFAIKNGLMNAQKQALSKSGKSQFGAASSNIPLIISDIYSPST
jgi:hypothetical protein